MFLLVTDFTDVEEDKWLVKELVAAGSHKNRVCRLLLTVRQIVSAGCYWLSQKSCLPVVAGCQKNRVCRLLLAVKKIVSAGCVCQTNRVCRLLLAVKKIVSAGCYWLSN
jgi:hypothetical protein